MSGQPSSTPLFVFGLLVLALIGGAIALGLWLGSMDFGDPPLLVMEREDEEKPPAEAEEEPEVPPAVTLVDAPVYFYANTFPGADLKAAAEEVRLAAEPLAIDETTEVAVNRCAVGVLAPWPEHGPTPAEAAEPLRILSEANPKAQFIVQLRLDPPQAWLDAHPDAAVKLGDEVQSRVCVASEAWREACQAALSALIQYVGGQPYGDQITGYALTCLEQGQWRLPEGRDLCEANTKGFRIWLSNRYADDKELREAWGDKKAVLAEAPIPPVPSEDESKSAFYTLPQGKSQVDYLEYVSDAVADAIAQLCGHIKEVSAREVSVFVQYGFSYEFPRNDVGHAAFGRILESEVDGFLSPVSYHKRGLGESGAFMGPVDSARARGKTWLIIDDTRTGIARDAATGETTRLPGVASADVQNVLRRNFAASATHGLSLVWADAAGNGALCDADLWRQLKGMASAYASSILSEQEAAPGMPKPFPPFPVGQPRETTLAVVVDEHSRFFQQRDKELNERLLLGVRESAARAGVPTRWCLLEDLLGDQPVAARVYLFLNAFYLPEERRTRLHDMLRERHATAIWMYAPGYITEEGADAEHVAETVCMPIKTFEKAIKGGSATTLSGKWVKEGQTFGGGLDLPPLFYVDDEVKDEKDKDKLPSTLAHYQEGEKPSVAILSVDPEEGGEGWRSVFVAEPELPTGLLREILCILELHQYVRSAPDGVNDVVHFGPGMLAVHASESGERVFDLGGVYDVTDVLDLKIGWPKKQQLTIDLRAGETKILALTPAVEEETIP